ncbi:PH domain-containing protein [Erythrobacter sp. JK5]|uniref:PH domain-containing protein n=1 Tax=Erythrobacter sp. JK5 TaxID=2829500 RepID=UPI001BA5ED28|nr:PH domain-containing protein [Erythrobacter sp. JK5]QUL37429.1 PH domain-containing protein [Erythrobacter sp. JK5]
MESTLTATPASPAAATFADPDGELTRVHPNYKSALRVRATITAIPFVIVALILETIFREQELLVSGAIAGPVLLIAIAFIIRLPSRRYTARGYAMSADRLRVVRGLLFRSDTVVPFGRVQHIDVDQGPIERFFDIATLTLHTAGSHNASVHLPGLQQDLARDMRETIRAHIRRESL